MKYLKLFESLEEPKIGDYVIMRINAQNDKINSFVNNTIGRLENKQTSRYIVEYENVPKEIEGWFGFKSRDNKCSRTFSKDRLLFFDKNKEDLETKIMSNKYNI